MAHQSVVPSYTQGHSKAATSTHERRTASHEAAFVLPHIKPHFRILDVGCGPGTITCGFAAHVPEGSVTGIDLSSEVLDRARDLAEGANVKSEGPGSVTFQQANVLEGLPFNDDSFDVCFTSQVIGHLSASAGQPLIAVKEMRRVLKPGGLLATREGLDGHFYPSTFNVDRLWIDNAYKVFQHGSPSEDAPAANMPALFRKAGFAVGTDQVIVSARTDVHSAPEIRKFFADRTTTQLGKEGGNVLRQAWLKAGISEEEIEECLKAVHAWAETEDAWMIGTQCEMLAWK
jgi:ubiquinone/menaquinone biosynthesis C-methylase UbiE